MIKAVLGSGKHKPFPASNYKTALQKSFADVQRLGSKSFLPHRDVIRRAEHPGYAHICEAWARVCPCVILAWASETGVVLILQFLCVLLYKDDCRTAAPVLSGSLYCFSESSKLRFTRSYSLEIEWARWRRAGSRPERYLETRPRFVHFNRWKRAESWHK